MQTISLEDYGKLIFKLLKSDRDVNIAVGGMTGEGKSTFSTKLQKSYAKSSGDNWSFKRMTWSRKEMMEWPVLQKIIQVAKTSNVNEIDITGGTPELNPNLKRFIKALRKTVKNIKVRTNLTVCSEPGMEIYDPHPCGLNFFDP